MIKASDSAPPDFQLDIIIVKMKFSRFNPFTANLRQVDLDVFQYATFDMLNRGSLNKNAFGHILNIVPENPGEVLSLQSSACSQDVRRLRYGLFSSRGIRES